MLWSARGHLLFVRGDLESALREYQTVLARNPSDAWAHARIGSVLLQLARLEEVESHIAAAKHLNPLEGLQVGFGHFIAGMAEFHLSRVDAAHERMQQSLAANPNNLQAWAWRAAIDTLQGRPAQAQEALDELRRRRPNMTIRALRGYLGERPANARLQPGNQRITEALKQAGLPE